MATRFENRCDKVVRFAMNRCFSLAAISCVALMCVGCGQPSDTPRAAVVDTNAATNAASKDRQADSPKRSLADADIAPANRPEMSLGRTAEYDYDPPEPGSYQLPTIMPAADGPVLRLDGQPGQLRDLMKGQVTVLSFIYTRCKDPTACPYALSTLYKIRELSEQDPILADHLRLMTFSFDPDHDKPHVLSDYTQALRQGSGSEWMFMTAASSDDLAPILKAYGQQVDRRKDPNHPLGPFSHLLRVYLIDRDGMIRNIYSTGMLDPRLVLTDVRTLLLEEQASLRGESPEVTLDSGPQGK